ncbi:hypothetical protein PVAP13_9NG371900 [Panicum virgatum]|uniref:TTF-type domain-containing protein n=1 Tax=Panicum virgatum TaxID=38727 RepID=A0A8T0MRY8_PANVG|nr:hypothetical protein PVAP13_9NG371900 [Panicum virgatum]
MPPQPQANKNIVEEHNQEKDGVQVEEIADPLPSPPAVPLASPPPPASKPPVYDINRLPYDPAERQPIEKYNVNDQDAIRRAYITRGPCKPYIHDFPYQDIGGVPRRFSIQWLYNYEWLEYSVKKDSGFCFMCYLFKKGSGSNSFSVDGWNNWNRGNDALLKHCGSKAHKAAEERYIGFINPKVSIDYNIDKWSEEDVRLYKKRLTYSLRCIKFLLHQGLAFRGHDESEESSNRGNFIELLKFLAENSEEVNKYVLNNAPGNCTLTSPNIQKQIIHCCALETRKKIIEELGDEPYAILADESSDISHKEQLALCLRYVDKLGRPCEHFIGVVHVDDTTSLSLKKAIEGLLVSNGLSMQQIRGQGYDGASNMKGDIKGLKTLIMQESPSAYYIHCFAHQLQLVLVAVAMGNTNCKTFFDQRHDMLRNARLENMGLPRPGDTRWGSHYKTICIIIIIYSSIHDMLIELGADKAYKDDWTKIHFVFGAFESFEFVFFVHLMYVILGYTNELSECLQRRDQDILNAISLVNVAKSRMQELRSNGWDNFLQKVTSFCIKHGVEVPDMDGAYVPYGKSARYARARNQTNDDHFRREVYIGVIDQISQEFDNRFDEINMELLSCMSAFSPSNSFASFIARKTTLFDLSVKLVETKRHKVYDMVYLLLKLILLLPVATASVERVFSALVLVKTKSRNKIADTVLDDCLVTFIERDIFFQIDEDDIMETFMSLRKRRINK